MLWHGYFDTNSTQAQIAIKADAPLNPQRHTRYLKPCIHCTRNYEQICDYALNITAVETLDPRMRQNGTEDCEEETKNMNNTLAKVIVPL